MRGVSDDRALRKHRSENCGHRHGRLGDAATARRKRTGLHQNRYPALITPSAAEAYYTSSTTSSNSTGTTAYPNEIVELAKALNNNVDEIYDFVRNYVDTAFIFGLQKGAVGALVDKSGTPFDQAKLMVDLLRQAGYATANYKLGQITLSGAQFQAWTNITNAQAACNLLASGGMPAVLPSSNEDNTFFKPPSGMCVCGIARYRKAEFHRRVESEFIQEHFRPDARAQQHEQQDRP